MTVRFLEVLLDAPLPALDYILPEGETAEPGERVVVPLGPKRKDVGIVVRVKDSTEIEESRMKPVISVLHDVPALRGEWLSFTRFAADYYIKNWGETAVAALPLFFRKVPGAKFQKSLESFRAMHVKKTEPTPRVELNDEQRAAVEAVVSREGYATYVLFGVTGSGKTEVYLHLIEETLKKHPTGQVLLLVPEINLTPQLEARVRGRFVDELVVTMHSNLTPNERAKSWLAVHEGRARVLVGTRMTIFTSFADLKLVLVDEEHDQSYKAGEGLRFSARDLAVKRAHDNNIACVLGSATPSLETWARAQAGVYRLLRLTHRAVRTASLPSMQLIDVSQRKPRVFAPEIKEAIDETLSRGEQVLVFINRRGYAPVITCTSCGWVSRCIHCTGFTVFHKAGHALVCHHCGASYPVPERCPSCGNPEIIAIGTGTQRIEEGIETLWPQARVLRIDRDSVRTKNAAEAAFESVHAGEVDIIVGTQMIAKGHDFKRVSLVVVLNADAQLVSPSVRAEEHLFATLLQVAGRAGRDKLAGRVMIQTRFPTHPIYADVRAQDYEHFAARLLSDRREAYAPPYSFQALLTAQSDALERTLGFLRLAKKCAEELDSPDIAVYDPVPMVVMRLKDAERGQLLIESLKRPARQAFLHQFAEALKAIKEFPDVSWSIEVDPQDV